MESELIARRIEFTRFLLELLDKYEDLEAEEKEARFRPGGKIDLSTLGEQQWLENFR